MLEQARVLIFGDSNTSDYFRAAADEEGDDDLANGLVGQVHVERYDGLALRDELFPLLFTTALHEGGSTIPYDIVLLSIGSNDLGGCSVFARDEMQELLRNDYLKLKRCFGNEFGEHSRLFIVGPLAPDIDTDGMETADGVHFTRETRVAIGRRATELVAAKQASFAAALRHRQSFDR